MANISIIARSGGTTTGFTEDSASVISSDIVKLKINPQDITAFNRFGNDLVITLKTGEKVTIQNYFVVDAQGHGNELVFEDQNGALWWVKDPLAGLHFEPLADINALMFDQSNYYGALPWGLGALGVAALGGGIAIAANNSGGASHHRNEDSSSDSDSDVDRDSDSYIIPPNSASNLVITDNVELKTGPITYSGVTNDNTPTFSGTALANATVTIYDGDTVLGSTKADTDGKWEFMAGALADGVHNFSITVSNGILANGHSGTFVVTIDTEAPGEVTMLIATDNQTPVLGTISEDETTNDNTPVISGKAEPGSTVNIYDGATLVGSAVADSQGNWGLDLSSVLRDGQHSLSAQAVDSAGNTGPATDPLRFTVDTDSPRVVGNYTVNDDVAPGTGPLTDGGITNDSRPTFTGAVGSAEGGSTVSIYDGSTLLGIVVASADGSWQFTPDVPLANGRHLFVVTATDAAGNVSHGSEPLNVEVQLAAGPISNLVVIDDVASITGPLANGVGTNDTTPTFSGTGSPGSILQVYDNWVLINTLIIVNPLDGTWIFTPQALSGGLHSFTFVDVATQTRSEPFVLTVDTQAPNPAGDITVVGDLSPNIGQLQSGDSTNDGTPIISGAAEPGTTVTIYDGGAVIGSVLVGADGQWGFTPDTALTDGTHHITTTVTDVAGNVSAPSSDFVLVIDTVALDPVMVFVATESIALDSMALYDGLYNEVLLDSLGNTLDTDFSTVLTSVRVIPEVASTGVMAEGQIAEISLGMLWASITLSNERGQQISEVASNRQSQALEGLYGTLIMHADGSYSYSLHDGVSVANLTQREQFDYTLEAPDGALRYGSLTIALHPQAEGNDKADTTASSVYDDTYTLGGGADTLIFNLLDNSDTSGDNGQDNHWTDFSVSEGDHIDISHLLSDWSSKSNNLGQYFSIEHTASGDTVVSIDRDGEGSKYQLTGLITLDGAQPTLEELLHHGTAVNHV